MLNDLRHLLRNLRRSPASAVAAILTLSLTLGAGASIFAVVDAVLLTPPPFADPDALVRLGENADTHRGRPWVRRARRCRGSVWRRGEPVSGRAVVPRRAADRAQHQVGARRTSGGNHRDRGRRQAPLTRRRGILANCVLLCLAVALAIDVRCRPKPAPGREVLTVVREEVARLDPDLPIPPRCDRCRMWRRLRRACLSGAR